MQKRLIYRLQTRRGRGIYQDACKTPPTNRARHPLPHEDCALRWGWRSHRYEWHFGFASLEQLRAWFYRDEWLTRLGRDGVVLTVWEVPERYVQIGNTQAIFVKRRARRLEVRALNPASSSPSLSPPPTPGCSTPTA